VFIVGYYAQWKLIVFAIFRRKKKFRGIHPPIAQYTNRHDNQHWRRNLLRVILVDLPYKLGQNLKLCLLCSNLLQFLNKQGLLCLLCFDLSKFWNKPGLFRFKNLLRSKICLASFRHCWHYYTLQIDGR